MRPLVCLLSLTMGCQAYLAHPPSVYVCHTYPFCEMDLKTRTWSSSLTDGQGATTGMFEAPETPGSIRRTASQQANLSREGKVEDSECWINEAYCAPDYSVPPLTGTDVDSAAKCRAACKKDEDCNYFTFHNYHGQAKCYKLSACSLTVAKHCPSSGICASGSAECGCPSLEANPTDSSSTTAYATWSCDSGVDPYSQTIPAGTNCKTDCKGWTGQVSVSLASTCQPMGDWTDTETGYGKRSARNGRSFNLNKPDSGPIKCACRDLGPYNYNPNTRPGEVGITRFQCDNWSPEKYTAPLTISSNDRCDLFCDKALVKTIQCEANTWSGEPEKGFWCMSPPEQGAPAGIEGEQDGLPTVYSQPSGELELKRNTLLTTLPSLGLQWEIAFQFKPTNYDNSGWTNILHMTIGDNNAKLGDRIPAFFFKPSVGWMVATTIGSDKNSEIKIKPPPPVGQWSTVVLSQLKTGSTTTFSVKINDAAPLARENPAPRAFSSVKVFASNPWYTAQPGLIRGLTIKTQ